MLPNPQTLFAGTEDARIFRSGNGGHIWQVTYAPNAMQPAGVVGIAVHPRHPDVVYAAHTVYHGGTLLLSVAYQAPMGEGVRFFRASYIRPATELSEGLPTALAARRLCVRCIAKR